MVSDGDADEVNIDETKIPEGFAVMPNRIFNRVAAKNLLEGLCKGCLIQENCATRRGMEYALETAGAEKAKPYMDNNLVCIRKPDWPADKISEYQCFAYQAS